MTATLDIGEAFTQIAPEVTRWKQQATVRPTHMSHDGLAHAIPVLVGRWLFIYNSIKNIEIASAQNSELLDVMRDHIEDITKVCDVGCDMIIVLQKAEDVLKANYEKEQAQLKFGIRMLTLITDWLRLQ